MFVLESIEVDVVQTGVGQALLHERGDGGNPGVEIDFAGHEGGELLVKDSLAGGLGCVEIRVEVPVHIAELVGFYIDKLR